MGRAGEWESARDSFIDLLKCIIDNCKWTTYESHFSAHFNTSVCILLVCHSDHTKTNNNNNKDNKKIQGLSKNNQNYNKS